MKQEIQKRLQQAIEKLHQTGQFNIDLTCEIQIETPRDLAHGDFSSNIALSLAKQAQCSPRALAKLIVSHFPQHALIEKIKIEGPGFINFFVKPTPEQHIVSKILAHKSDFGKADIGCGKKVIVEFVSVNPTGPLHVGHARGAVYGAVISDILEWVGYAVHREYYFNDAGRQIELLTLSVWLRYLELFGSVKPFPESAYRGEYIKEMASALKEYYGDKFKLSQPLETDQHNFSDAEAYADALIGEIKKLFPKAFILVQQFSLDLMIQDIKSELAAFGIHFQKWFSERTLIENGDAEKSLAVLRAKNYLYEREGATWFKSSEFGDDKDRVVIRSQGQFTYFAPDIAYHFNKIQRGFDIIIDVFGADHHGYVARLKAAIIALGFDKQAMYFPLVQIVHLYRGDQKVQMSKRSGSFETLKQMREEIGKDAVRFFLIMRKVDQHLDFDLDLAKSQSHENPLYYIQYAHARICSVIRQLQEKKLVFEEGVGLHNLILLNTEQEKKLIAHLSRYEELLVDIARTLTPYRLAHYLRELATLFHAYYNALPFLVDDTALRNARLCLILGVKQVIITGFALLGVSAPELM